MKSYKERAELIARIRKKRTGGIEQATIGEYEK